MSGMENNFSLVGCMEEIPDPRAPYIVIQLEKKSK